VTYPAVIPAMNCASTSPPWLGQKTGLTCCAWPQRTDEPGGLSGEPVRHQHKSNAGLEVEEDQHLDNTDETALLGTRRPGCYDDHAGRMISQNAGELG